MSSQPPPGAEKFLINVAELGKAVAIREAPDEMLEKYLKQSQAEAQTTMGHIQNSVNAMVRIAEFCSALAYEIDRRARIGGLLVSGAGLPRDFNVKPIR